MKYLITLSLLVSFSAFTQTIEQEITEGKIQSAEAELERTREANEKAKLEKSVDTKMQTAIILIARVAAIANERTTIGHDYYREEAEYAHSGYIAIIQSIREEREAYAKKNIAPDVKALQTYSRRLDYVIEDAQKLLN